MNHTIRKIAGGAIVIGVLSPPLTGLAKWYRERAREAEVQRRAAEQEVRRAKRECDALERKLSASPRGSPRRVLGPGDFRPWYGKPPDADVERKQGLASPGR